MSDEPIVLSHSRVKQWRRCQKAHSYKYDEKLERKTKSVPLRRGTILHECIDAWINKKSPQKVLDTAAKDMSKLFEEERAMYGNLVEECTRIAKGYTRVYKTQRSQYVKLGGLKSEIHFDLEIAEGLNILGYIDGVLKDEDGLLWIVEHKTHEKIPDEGFRMTDIQALIYCYAIEQIYDVKISGVLWDYLRTKTPTVPKLLKNGTLSKAKNIDTTDRVYKKAIKDNGLDPADYQDMLEMLEGSEKNYYRQIRLPISKHMVNEVIEDLIATGSDIYAADGHRKPRSPDMHCSWCDFKTLCEVEVRGADSDFIRQKMFTKRKRGKNGSKKKK